MGSQFAGAGASPRSVPQHRAWIVRTLGMVGEQRVVIALLGLELGEDPLVHRPPVVAGNLELHGQPGYLVPEAQCVRLAHEAPALTSSSTTDGSASATACSRGTCTDVPIKDATRNACRAGSDRRATLESAASRADAGIGPGPA